MSGFGGFGGFGQNNTNNQQQQQSTGFGGFGATNTNTGFGATANNTGGFGSTSNATSGGLFGGGGTSGGFGAPANSGGFGASNPGGFGAKPAFGASTSTAGGGLFGGSGTTANSGSFGFGANQNNTTTSAFGSNTGGGGLFGAAKPATGFGGATSSPFGAAQNTTSGFGGAATGAFGSPATTLGANNVGESPGTGGTAFQPFIEKEANSTTQNAFQSISFQAPYAKFSPEELRLADYNQGRKSGNGSTSGAGSFGTSNFGGFGATNTAGSAFGATNNNNTGGGLFGNNNNNNTATPGAFGQTPAAGGFGSNTGGSLFGAKPATGGGLFGATQTPAPATGGLFGATQSTGFGATPAANTGFGGAAAGSSLFGNNNQQKSGFSFGAQPASSSGGFGAATATTGGFGSNTGGGLFGNNNTQQQTSNPFGGGATGTNPALFGNSGGFGANNNQPQQQQQTGGLFGSTPAKPAGSLFGNNTATTGGGLFGNTQQNASNNPFGGNSASAGGLFGAKPAATGGSLFGNTGAQPNTGGGGLFGGSFNNQNQQQQNTGGGLFGSSASTAAKPSMFGAQPQQPGSSLFGNSGQQGGGGLFGNQNNNQAQQPQGNSAFGGSSMFPQQPASLTASINDPRAFGGSMFASLATPEHHNPGPIATPLSSLSKQKKPGIIPTYKLNPASSSRFSTPNQKRGFGFSYSTYGTPGSGASSASSTPLQLGGSMFGSSLGRGLTKSMSTSSLRGSFSREDSILAPGAFSASPNVASRFNSTGSMKKLVINRTLRTDLFSPPKENGLTPPSNNASPGILKKRVSFESSTAGGRSNGFPSPLKQVESSATPSAEEMGFLRSRTNGSSSKPNIEETQQKPEMEQVNGKELAIVPEEEASAAASKPRTGPVSQEDQQPGQYWMSPSKQEIQEMNRIQRSKVSNFTIGREGVGKISFTVPVDLNTVDLDDIYNKTVILDVRQATVYPNPATKPPMGRCLNVPSRIELQNSWPRGKDKRHPSHERSGSRFQKHIERLSKVKDTTFVDYNKDTGVWTFTVEHFTTYGLEYDDETDGEAVSEYDQSEFGQSTLSAPPDTPTPQQRTPKPFDSEQSFTTNSESFVSDPEDTFDFKKRKVASGNILPGAFDEEEMFVGNAEMEDEYADEDRESFLDDRSVGSQSQNGIDEPMDHEEVLDVRELVRIEDQEMVGSYPDLDVTTGLDDMYSPEDDEKFQEAQTPGAVMRARMRARIASTPSKRKLQIDDDEWTNMLQKTISPRKQDRAQLKRVAEAIANGHNAQEEVPTPRGKIATESRGFATGMDLMHSLFGETKSPAKPKEVSKEAKGFQWPYAKSSKNYDDPIMDFNDRAFHDSMKPSWSLNGTLVFAPAGDISALATNSRRARERDGLLVVQKGGIVSEGRDVRFATFSNESSMNALKKQKAITAITTHDNIPQANLPPTVCFSQFFDDDRSNGSASLHENQVWELLSVLYDPIKSPAGVLDDKQSIVLLRKDKFSAFWQKIVGQAVNRDVAMAKSWEEKAIASLSGHRIADACTQLLNGKDYHLATLVALIGNTQAAKKDIREQLNEWQKSRVLSEISQPVRALYELLAGNACVCDGAKTGPTEDRVESFVISQRFGFDWRQAFGLRVWYAIGTSGGVWEAVRKFHDDLKQDKESSKPRPWYVEQGVTPIWNDPSLNTREDLLWGLLKLYSIPQTDLEEVLRPENSQLSPLDFRLSWQLSCAIIAQKHHSYGENTAEKADRLTMSFASQLTNEGQWLDAVFVLVHLSNSAARARSIQNHLAHFAGKIGSEDSPSFITLASDLHVPVTWIWEAKALYMRSVQKDPRREVECLIRAGLYDEAHRTFGKEVAPKTVIERDWETLSALLADFKGKENSISDWHLGGGLYADYVKLVTAQKYAGGLEKLETHVIERLVLALPAMLGGARSPTFMETVAVQEIGAAVAKAVVELGRTGQYKNQNKVLKLPLTEDKYLKHTVELSLGYYKSVMATGR